MNFIDLHTHSTHSNLDAFGLPDQMVERAVELGRPAMALTDHGSTSGHVQFEQAAKTAGIKPVFGCEFYTSRDATDRRQDKDHLTVLAETPGGYKNLINLVTLSYSPEGFYYRPTVNGEMLAGKSDGLIVLSGCTNSYVSKLILGVQKAKRQEAPNLKLAEETILGMRRVLGDRFYLEIQPGDFQDTRVVNEFLIAQSDKHNIPLAVTMDVHYMVPEEVALRKLLHSVQRRQTVTEVIREYLARGEKYPDYHYQMPWEDLVLHARRAGIDDLHLAKAAEATIEIAARCNVTLPKASPLEFPLPPEVDKEQHLAEIIRAGFSARFDGPGGGWDDIPLEEYKRRAEYEFNVICDKGYIDYFLVVSDLCQWAKQSGIFVGPARGSSAGSLICYLLQITEVDPLRHGLMFERFLDPSRDDPPDIDIDFEDTSRDAVKGYLSSVYGEGRVAAVGTFTQFRARNTINEVVRAYGLPPGSGEALKRNIVTHEGEEATLAETIEGFPEAARVLEHYPQFNNAVALDGQIRNNGTHAAGILVASDRLTDYMALYTDGKIGEARSAYDYAGCEYLGFLKIDVLGLKALTRLHMMAGQAGMGLEDVYRIPLDDPATMEGFRAKDLLGIFQFEGGATRQVLGQMADLRGGFQELVDINALSRPGPLNSGGTARYIASRHRPEWDKLVIHKALDPFTATTQGQILYQEQVVKIVREIGGFSWADANKFRKAIAKSAGRDVLEGFREKFLSGARETGLGLDAAGQIFSGLVTFGAYGFNLSHAVSYTYLSWFLMWFKTHHPGVFYWAMIASEGDADVQRRYMAEYVARGGTLLPPRLGKSGVGWTLEGDMAIRAGFTQIVGVGEKGAEAIIRVPWEGDYEAWLKAVNKTVVNRNVQARLLETGCFDADDGPGDYLGLKSEEAIFAEIPGRKPISHIDEAESYDTLTLAGRVREVRHRSMLEPNLVARRNGEPFREPELIEWVDMVIEDPTGLAMIRFDRVQCYPKNRGAIDKYEPGHIIYVTGSKQAGRPYVYVRERPGKWEV